MTQQSPGPGRAPFVQWSNYAIGTRGCQEKISQKKLVSFFAFRASARLWRIGRVCSFAAPVALSGSPSISSAAQTNSRGSRGTQGAPRHSQRGEDSDILRSPRMVALRLQYRGAQNCGDAGCGRSSGSRRPVWRTARPHLPGPRLRGVYHQRGSPLFAGSASVLHAYAHVVDFGREIELGTAEVMLSSLLWFLELLFCRGDRILRVTTYV